MTEPATKSSKSPLLIVFVTVFIDLLGFAIVLPLLPRYATAFEASNLRIGLLMASFSAMQFVFAPIWGRISDRIGRRPVLLVGLAGATLFYGLFGYATSLGRDGLLLGLDAMKWLFITRIGAGIACATIPTAQAYIADVTTAENRTKGMAMIGAAFGIGFTFGPLIGAAFVSEDPAAPPSSMAGYVASGLSGLAFLWAVAKLPESLKPGTAPASGGHFQFSRIGSAFRHPGVFMVLMTILLTTTAFGQFETTLSKLTQSLGLGDRSNFYIFAYVGFVLTVAQGGIVRKLATKMRPEKLALGGSLLMVVGLLLIGLAAEQHSLCLLYAFLPIVVLGFAALTPSLQSLISLRSPVDRQGEFLGVGQSMSALARILGPIIGFGVFSEQQLGRPYWVGAGLMVVGVLFVWLLRSPTTTAAK